MIHNTLLIVTIILSGPAGNFADTTTVGLFTAERCEVARLRWLRANNRGCCHVHLSAVCVERE